MKDGDVSLILKNVMVNDTGTYKCEAFSRGTNVRNRANLVGDPISIVSLKVDPSDQKIVTAEPGQKNVTLPCRAPNNSSSITGVEWSRADLGDEYVLLYRDDQFDPTNQHPSFKNRVDLKDRQMKDGDVSLILKDVMINDTGTYKCEAFIRGTNVRKRANLVSDPISIVTLKVDPPGQTGGSAGVIVGVIAGLSVFAVILVAVAAVGGFVIYKKHKQSQDSEHPPGELQTFT